jgi:phosphoglucosamine mutase
VAALQVLQVVVTGDRSLAELKGRMTKFPQTLVNVPIEGPVDIERSPAIDAAVKDVERTLGERGRVLLRPSGTEPLLRVMVEGEDARTVRRLAEQIASAVREVSEGG